MEALKRQMELVAGAALGACLTFVCFREVTFEGFFVAASFAAWFTVGLLGVARGTISLRGRGKPYSLAGARARWVGAVISAVSLVAGLTLAFLHRTNLRWR